MAHAGGRPSLLTPERKSRYLDAIKTGMYVEVAATYAGIDKSTVWRWLARGREAAPCDDHEVPAAGCEPCAQWVKDAEYREFFDSVKEAEAQIEQQMIALVIRAAVMPQHWTAAMTFLERRFRDRWARPAGTAAVDGDGSPASGVPVTVEVDDVPVKDRLAGILEVLDRAGKLHDPVPASTNGSPEQPVP